MWLNRRMYMCLPMDARSLSRRLSCCCTCTFKPRHVYPKTRHILITQHQAIMICDPDVCDLPFANCVSVGRGSAYKLINRSSYSQFLLSTYDSQSISSLMSDSSDFTTADDSTMRGTLLCVTHRHDYETDRSGIT